MRRLAFGRPTACVLIHTIAEGGKCYATNYLTTFNTDERLGPCRPARTLRPHGYRMERAGRQGP